MTSSTIGDPTIKDMITELLTKQADSSVINPPTSGPGAGAPPDEDKHTEGAASKEQDAALKEQMGQAGPMTTIPAGQAKGNPNPPEMAAQVLPSGEDPANESHDTGTADGIDPGTSVEGATLNEKTAAWQESAAQLILDLIDGEPAADKTAAEVGDNDELISTLEEQAMLKLAAEHQYGRDLARTALACLSHLNKVAGYKERIKHAFAEGLDGEGPDGEGVPVELLAGGDEPGMGGGGDPGMGGEEDPEAFLAAIEELAAEVGIPPEALLEELMAAEGDELDGGEEVALGGGEDLPPGAEAPPAEELPVEAPAAEGEPPVEVPAEAVPVEEKEAAELVKVRERAKSALADLLAQGRRNRG